MTYEEFIESKRRRYSGVGFEWDGSLSWLFPFQQYVTSWALRKGRCCVFAGTGLGKTRMQIAAASAIRDKGEKVLILAPLAVKAQTIREAACVGVALDGITVENYDQLPNVRGDFGAILLDESSIIKSHDGVFRKALMDRFKDTPFRLAYTATPAPNDYMELGTHAEFIGAASRLEMLAEYFTHDGGDTSKWRLKRHAVSDFWQWVSQWAICFDNPQDIGFDGSKYLLPELTIHEHVIGDYTKYGGLFGGIESDVNATSIRAVQRESIEHRISKTIELESESDSQCIIWCSTNEEQSAITKAIPGSVSVAGSDPIQHKEDSIMAFAEGKFKTIITKPSIAGFGVNWQNCSRMIFASISYSFESMHQSIRRCWRFGQIHPVDVHLIYGGSEESIRESLRVKHSAHESMSAQILAYAHPVRFKDVI